MPELSPSRTVGAFCIIAGLCLVSLSGVGLYWNYRNERAQANVIPPFTATPENIVTLELAVVTTSTMLPTRTPEPTRTPTATETPSRAATPTTLPVTPTPPCECYDNLYNCSDLYTHRKAQACYDYCISLGVGDVHDLDRDGDGRVCED